MADTVLSPTAGFGPNPISTNQTVGGTLSVTGNTTLTGDLTARANAFIKGPNPWADVKAWGAVGDGVTDDSAAIQNAINNVPAAGGTVFFPPGTYIVNTTLALKSNLTLLANRGTALIKRTAVGNIAVKTGGINNFTIQGVQWDMTNVGGSALLLSGADATAQVTNLTIRDCDFLNPSPANAWIVQINYTIVDPTIPTSKNQNILIDNCTFDGAGQTGTLETTIFVNCENLRIQGCTFKNTPSPAGAIIAIYGYNRNVKLIGNHFAGYTCNQALYVQQSDRVQLIGNTFTTTSDVRAVTIFNSEDVSFDSNVFAVGANGSCIVIRDAAGTTFDAHTNLYNPTRGVSATHNTFVSGTYGLTITGINRQSQSDLSMVGNTSKVNSLFELESVPASPDGPIKRISIVGNSVISHKGSTGNGCILILGNASATNGGVQGIVIADNTIPASSVGSGEDISIVNKADDILIHGNRLNSPSTIGIAAAATNLKIWQNAGYNPKGQVTAPGFPATGVNATNNTGVDVTAFVANGANAITQIQVGGVNTNMQIAVNGWASIRVPAGQTINFTYGGGAPAWTWFGD